MHTTTTAPSERIEPLPNELPVVEFSHPQCPECGRTDLWKNGKYTRHPHGRDSVRVQRYQCPNCPGSFSPSLPEVDDGHRYSRHVRHLGRVVNAFTDASLEAIQDICTIHYGTRPSDQQIHNWITDDPGQGEIVNDLPVYSGIYSYDEQYIRINGERVYRLTVYDELMHAPVAESLADRCTKQIVRDFLQTVLAEKPTYVITTDGRSEYTEIIEDDLGAFHHRCQFHFLGNGEKKLRNRVFRSVRYTDSEKLRGAVVWSEFKQVFAAPAYEAAVRRFEAVLDKVEQLPREVRGYVQEVKENFDRFALHLRDEWVPSTTNNLERYYGHTKPTQIKRRFRSKERARSFLHTQMRVRTLKNGLMSRDWSLSVGRDVFPTLESKQMKPLFTEPKRRYLWWRDLEAG